MIESAMFPGGWEVKFREQVDQLAKSIEMGLASEPSIADARTIIDLAVQLVVSLTSKKAAKGLAVR